MTKAKTLVGVHTTNSSIEIRKGEKAFISYIKIRYMTDY